jgi:Transposase IS116/IS110/IS902 family/Phage integrase, N-terminal SAM-like domain
MAARKGGITERTMLGYASLIEHKIIPALGELRLSRVDTATIDRFLAQLSERGTRRKHCQHLVRIGQAPLRAGDRYRPRPGLREREHPTDCLRGLPPRSSASHCSASRPRPWSTPARPCGQDRSPAPPPPPRPPCGPWPGAGNSSRPNSTSSTATCRTWSPRPPRHCWPCPGVGVDTAGQLLVTAGDNPQRLRSEATFAHLCGTAPIPASSGRTDRHRLNRAGDRQANNALWRIALVRMRCRPPTRAYVERRTKQGLSKLDILRCLKRYLAREIHQHLTSPPPTAPAACPK